MSERGRLLPWYGQIQCKDNPEAAAIWRSRPVEPVRASLDCRSLRH